VVGVVDDNLGGSVYLGKQAVGDLSMHHLHPRLGHRSLLLAGIREGETGKVDKPAKTQTKPPRVIDIYVSEYSAQYTRKGCEGVVMGMLCYVSHMPIGADHHSFEL
jgi:hypothetical protein